jgi:hypothetical protein
MNAPKTPIGRPTADTLTDRYVWAVLKALPEDQRADIDRELRATIADDVDARVEAGATEAEALRAALLELGRPSRLAAGYSGRPLWLIGPDLFIDYVRLLKLLAVIVLPLVAVTIFVVNALSGVPIGEVIGATVATVISTAVHLGFWTTFVFVLVERTGAAKPGGVAGGKDSWVPFDPDHLAPVPVNVTGRSDLIASLVFLLLVPVALVWQHFSSVVEREDGTGIPLIDPALWSFWLPYFIVMSLVAAGFAIVLYRVGHWTWPLVGVNAIITVATTVPVVWLIATGSLANPEFLDHFGWARYVAEGSPGAIATAASIAAISAWAIIDSIAKTRRAGRGIDLAEELKERSIKLIGRL